MGGGFRCLCPSGKLYLRNRQYRVLRLIWVVVISYVDFLQKQKQNGTIQNLNESELR